MARQQGLHPLTGTFSGVNYYYDKKWGYLVRQKPGPTKEQVKNNPEFQRTRENNSEFGRACKFTKLIYDGFRPIAARCKDDECWRALFAEVRAMIKMDTEHLRGERMLSRYALEGLDHFELDCKSLSKKYFDKEVLIDARDGVLEVAASVNLQQRKWGGIEGFEMVSIVTTVNPRQTVSTRNYIPSPVIPYEAKSFAFNFTHHYDEDSLVFYGIGILFHERCKRTGHWVLTEKPHRHAGFIKFVR